MAKNVMTKEEKEKNEKVIFGALVREQKGPVIYKVLTKGVCVEFTDEISRGKAAYAEASKPKQMFAITRATGAVSKLYEEIL
jgi:hypothetical protein